MPNITVYIPKALAEKLKKFSPLNKSAIVSAALKRALIRKEKKS